MKKFLLIFFIFFICKPFWADNSIKPNLPYRISDEMIKPLIQLLNPDLQMNLEKQLRKNNYWRSLISRKKMAVGIIDISDSSNIKFARMNGNEMMYAASLPKIAILLATYQSFEDSVINKTPDIMNDLRLMISKSSNPAATRMIDRIGFKKIQAVLTDPKYKLYDEDRGGGLWVGKRYAKIGGRFPDPMKGLSHAATVTQICRFYYLLVMGKLVNYESSKEMLDMLSDPELHHKFVFALEQIAPRAKLFRKSGTWKTYHSDSILVWGPVWRRYIVTAMIDDIRGEKILRDLIPVIEDALNNK